MDFNKICNYHDLQKYENILKKVNGFKILHINIRSIEGKFNQLCSFVHSLGQRIDVLCVTETWLNEDNKNFFNIPNYHSYHLTRTTREHGGVSIFVHARLKSKQLIEFTVVDEDIEINSIKVYTSESDYNICAIYRPNCDGIGVNDFVNRFTSILDNTEISRNMTIVIGDLNINLLNDNLLSNLYLSMLQSQSFFPLISRPTRFPDSIGLSDPSLLDHIFTNFVSEFTSGILHYPFSDHLPIFITIPGKFTPSKTKKSFFQRFQ